MSFGLKSFKKQKDDSKSAQGRTHISQVILGGDLAAVLKLVELKKTFSPTDLRLITPRFLTKQHLIENYESSVSTLRDNALTLEIAAKFPNAKSVRFENESLFMKDGSWHKFGSRAKPMEFQTGEDYFLNPRQEIELSSLFSSSDWNELDDILNTYQNVRILEKIEKQNPTDLASQDEWWMLFRDLSEVTCTDLWLSLAARDVLKASDQGQTLPTEMAAWLASLKRQAGITISWQSSKEMYPEVATLFVPQSMTHEWGHFIVDIHPYNEAKKSYPLNALILLHDEEPTSELMADKIKLCKRVFDRVFKDFSQSVSKEYIHASEDLFEIPSEPNLAESLLIGVPKLHMLGHGALTPAEAKFLPRSLLSL
ncbi:MAG: hypothetical protein K2P81_05790 [Bacteriovoracaceae bacterium]|nr:hypothetical protein [Bacteriovoracaceae bacterium]